MAQWARLMAKHWRADRTEVMGYGEPSGHAGLRRAIAGHLRSNRGIPCEADEIFIVGGAQQAFHLVGSVLLDPGDRVWFENPGAIGARNSLLACGADLVPVPVDREGLRVDDGLALARDFRLAFVTPSHQQPLGHIMSLERRFALLSAAEQAGAWIVEDDYDGEFFFGRRPLPTLKSVDRTGLVIYVGTFSKSLFPSLRLGFMLVPGDLVETFRRVAAAFVPGVPSSIQAAVAEFIDEGHFATHIRRMRRIYQERHGALCEAAARQLGPAGRRADRQRFAHDRAPAAAPVGAGRRRRRRRPADHRVADRPLLDRAHGGERSGAGIRRREATRDPRRGRGSGPRPGRPGPAGTATRHRMIGMAECRDWTSPGRQSRPILPR